MNENCNVLPVNIRAEKLQNNLNEKVTWLKSLVSEYGGENIYFFSFCDS